MNQKLSEFIEYLRNQERTSSLDEAAVKQAVVLRLLHVVGWDIFNIDEIVPEYASAGKRVDFALRIRGKPKVFLEVKRGNEDLQQHQEQLLSYCFQEGVSIGILTNGATWEFYLPLQEGGWEQRRFYTIDILQQEPGDIASKLISFLSRENVASGKAIDNAEQMYKGTQRQNILKETLPKAWAKIITEPDELLVDLLSETTEKICGYRPETEGVKDFLKQVPANHGIGPTPLIREKNKKKEKGTPPGKEKVTQDDLIPDIIQVLGRNGGRCKKHQVEKEIYEMRRNSFADSYWKVKVSYGVPRWKHQIAWAKERAKKSGVIKNPDESGRGIWELTQKGWKAFHRGSLAG